MSASAITGFSISPQQRQLWRLQQRQRQPQSWVLIHHPHGATAAVIRQRLQHLVAGEEALRTRLVCLAGMNEPLQVIAEPDTGPIVLDEITATDLDRARQEALRWCQNDHGAGQTGEGLQVRLYSFPQPHTHLPAQLNTDASGYLLALRAPSLLADSISLQLVAAELLAATPATTATSERLQYADYAAWRESLREDHQHPGVVYWQRWQEQRSPALHLRLAHDQTAPVQQANLVELATLHFPLTAWHPLGGKTAQSLEACLFTVWCAWLARLSDHNRFEVACYEPGRGDELDQAIGPYRQAVPVRVEIDSQQSFAHVLNTLNAARRETLGWRDYYTGAIDTTASFAYHHPIAAGLLDDNIVIVSHDDPTGLLHLSCEPQGDVIQLRLSAAAGFATSTRQCLAEQWQRWLDGVLERLQQEDCQDDDNHPSDYTCWSLSSISLLGAFQRQLISPAPPAAPWQALPVTELITRQAQQQPQATAIAFNDNSLGYAALNRRANQLAHYLRRTAAHSPAGDKEQPADQEIIGILLPRSLDLPISLLGVMKAGAAYLPLDPTYPPERLKHLIDDSGVRRVIYHSALLEQPAVAHLTAAPQLTAIDLATVTNELAQAPDAEPPPPPLGSLAYVIYTSGSTGRPKGVEITHAALSYSTQARAAYYREPVQAYLLLSSFAFDSSVAGIFWTLIQGGTLVLPQHGEELQPRRLAQLIQTHRVSHSLCLPSLYEAVLDQAQAQQLASLRAWIVAGETCPARLPAKHRGKLPHTGLFNEYGPTEATVWATVDELCAAAESTAVTASRTVTIGQPIPGLQLHVLNAAGVPAAVGEPGEIYLGGPTLARSYRHQPAQTADRFVCVAQHILAIGGKIAGHTADHRPAAAEDTTVRLYRTGDIACWRKDGRLDFLGRRDGQVKIRGHRVERGEIERVLLSHPDIAEAAVIIKHTAGTDHQTGADPTTTHSPTANLSPAADSAQAEHNPQSTARLLAYLVPRHGYTPETQALRGYLGQHLPAYMQPHALISLAQLPRGPNGKLDTSALPDEEQQDAVYVAPRNEQEAQLAAICAQVLGREHVGVHDNFFQIGGDSILSLQVVTRALQQGIEITARQIFDAQTVAAMAAVARFGVTPVSAPELDQTAATAGNVTPLTLSSYTGGGDHSNSAGSDVGNDPSQLDGFQLDDDDFAGLLDEIAAADADSSTNNTELPSTEHKLAKDQA